jgi:hypothetical protein
MAAAADEDDCRWGWTEVNVGVERLAFTGVPDREEVVGDDAVVGNEVGISGGGAVKFIIDIEKLLFWLLPNGGGGPDMEDHNDRGGGGLEDPNVRPPIVKDFGMWFIAECRSKAGCPAALKQSNNDGMKSDEFVVVDGEFRIGRGIVDDSSNNGFSWWFSIIRLFKWWVLLIVKSTGLDMMME